VVASMVAWIERDHGGASRVSTRDLDRFYRGFGARRDEQRFLPRRPGHDAIEAFGEAHVRFVHRDLEARVRKEFELTLDRGANSWMRVAEVENADASDEVEIL